MVKGVNRQVLEIHETGCEYFEKALFFVKPEFSGESENKLKSKAINSSFKSTTIPNTRQQKIKNREPLFYERLSLSLLQRGIIIGFYQLSELRFQFIPRQIQPIQSVDERGEACRTLVL